MLMHPTIDQLRTLKLDGVADAFTELQSQDSAPGQCQGQCQGPGSRRMAGAAARPRGGQPQHQAVP